MNEIEDIERMDGRIRETRTKFIFPLQATRILKRDAFVEYLNAVDSFAKAVKGCDKISKSLLAEIYSSSQILRNEAPFFRDQTATMYEMAAKLESLFRLILIGESSEDRVPGVPRIQ